MTWWNSTLGLFAVFKNRWVPYLLALLELIVGIMAIWKLVDLSKDALKKMRGWRGSRRFLLRGLG